MVSTVVSNLAVDNNAIKIQTVMNKEDILVKSIKKNSSDLGLDFVIDKLKTQLKMSKLVIISILRFHF